MRLQRQGAERRPGQLGPDRQIAAAAERQAVPRCPTWCSTSPTPASASTRRTGRLGFAVAGRGNLTGGFKGRWPRPRRVSTSAPAGSTACARNVAIAVVARRPQVAARSRVDRFNCPASRMAMPRRGWRSTAASARRSTNFDGKGRLAVASLTAGDNGLANLVANIGFKGTPTDASGRVRPRRAAGAAGDHLCRPHPARGRLSPAGGEGRCRRRRRLWREQRQPVGPDAGAADRSARRGRGHAARPDRHGRSPPRSAAPPAISTRAGRLRLVNFPGGGGVRIESADAQRPGRGAGAGRRPRWHHLLLAVRPHPHRQRHRAWAAAACRAPKSR